MLKAWVIEICFLQTFLIKFSCLIRVNCVMLIAQFIFRAKYFCFCYYILLFFECSIFEKPLFNLGLNSPGLFVPTTEWNQFK